jgi:hypothetical protein
MVRVTAARGGSLGATKTRRSQRRPSNTLARSCTQLIAGSEQECWGHVIERQDLQSALILVCLRAEGAKEEGGAVVEGVGRGRDGGHAVASVDDDEGLGREEVRR